MSSAALKLTPKPVTDRDSYLLERRASVRHPICGKVTAVQKEPGPDGAHNRICSVQLRNISSTGLGAICPQPIELNTSIAVFFPSHGNERGFDLFGTVVRCRATEQGHDIGIHFSTRMAA